MAVSEEEGGNGGPLEVGDAVVWVGAAEGFGHDVVWPPARVVWQESLAHGVQFVGSVGDTAAAPQLLSERREWSQGEPTDGLCPRADLPKLRVRSGRGAERAVVVHERSGLVHRR